MKRRWWAALAVGGLPLVGCAQAPATWSQVEANCVAQQGVPEVCRCFVDNLSRKVSLDRYQYLVERGLKERKPAENDWVTLPQAQKNGDELSVLMLSSMEPCATAHKDYLMKKR